MCSAPKIERPKPAILAAPNNREASRQGDEALRRRRARSGAAANILTGPLGIPATTQLGAPQ